MTDARADFESLSRALRADVLRVVVSMFEDDTPAPVFIPGPEHFRQALQDLLDEPPAFPVVYT